MYFTRESQRFNNAICKKARCSLNIGIRDSWFLGLMPDNESKEINRIIFECVAKCDSMIWLGRNNIIFEHRNTVYKIIEVEN